MAFKNYAADLLKFFKPIATPELSPAQSAPDRPKPFAEPTGLPGRPNSLDSKRFGQLLKAIAQENSKNETLKTNDGIAGKLIARPEYSSLSLRQLRRRVGQAMDWEIDFLENCPPKFWNTILGITPPSKMTRQFLRAKAFELLWNELRRHNELMAKKL
jgi:hypothetical protein